MKEFLERIFGTNTRDFQPLVHFHVPRLILKRSLFSTLKNCVRENNWKGFSKRALFAACIVWYCSPTVSRFFAACCAHPLHLAWTHDALLPRLARGCWACGFSVKKYWAFGGILVNHSIVQMKQKPIHKTLRWWQQSRWLNIKNTQKIKNKTSLISSFLRRNENLNLQTWFSDCQRYVSFQDSLVVWAVSYTRDDSIVFSRQGKI